MLHDNVWDFKFILVTSVHQYAIPIQGCVYLVSQRVHNLVHDGKGAVLQISPVRLEASIQL
jgi:hypothetical protein